MSFLLTSASKKGAAAALKFEAEATAFLQRSGVPLTQDGHKYEDKDVTAQLVAILGSSGFVQSTQVGDEGWQDR